MSLKDILSPNFNAHSASNKAQPSNPKTFTEGVAGSSAFANAFRVNGGVIP